MKFRLLTKIKNIQIIAKGSGVDVRQELNASTDVETGASLKELQQPNMKMDRFGWSNYTGLKRVELPKPYER